MHIIKNENNRYEVRFRGPDGKIKSKSTGKTNRKEAIEVIKEAKIEELERIAELGVLTQDVVSMLIYGRKVTVEAAIEHWVTWMKSVQHSASSVTNGEIYARAWARDQGVLNRPIIGIGYQEIDAWVNNPAIRAKAGTRGVMLSALRSLFKFAFGSGMCLGNPASLVRVNLGLLSHEQKEVKKKLCFTDSEIQQLLDLTAPGAEREDEFWHAAVAIGRWTGLRIGDVAALEWDSFRLPGRIVVWTQKRDKRVELPLEPEALRNAVSALPMDDEKYVFPNQALIIRNQEMRSTLSRQFTDLCERAGIKGKSFHCLRATYISACDAAGIPIEHIARSVGHSRTATTSGYIRDTD